MLNKVVLMGRLTKDPELKTTSSDVSLCNFTIAVDRSYNRELTDFINVIAWRSTAEFCNKYFKKGQQIAISGRLQTSSWENADGEKKYSIDVIADEVFFADSKKANDASVMEHEELYSTL